MPPNDPTARTLLALVQQLARELNPRVGELTLDSALEGDAGIDSLARMELLLRIERAFGRAPPERIALEAATPRDLLEGLGEEKEKRGSGPAFQQHTVGMQDLTPTLPLLPLPATAQSFVEVLEWQYRHQPDRTAVYLYGENEHCDELSYAALWNSAQRIAAGLRAHGLEPGRSVALMLPTSAQFLFCFYGIWLAGGVPVPLYPPQRPSQLEEHLRRQIGILDNAQAGILLAMPEARRLAPLLKAHLPELRAVLTPEECTVTATQPLHLHPAVQDLALLQYTSGSTGQPKGVALTHANLLANVRAMGIAARATAGDVFVSWLPLYHDMGLIGAVLGTLYHGFPLVLMSPLAFIARPQRWLRAIHRHRGTLSAAPNFAYDLCAGKLLDADLEGLDLGSWRMAFNGAEPVSAETVERFCARFAPYGFRHETMAPVYGLAESCVGLAFPPLDRGPRIDRIRRSVLLDHGRAEPAGDAAEDVMQVPGCGLPLPGHEIRIVDAVGHELGERRVGRVEFRGPSATQGYFRNPEATRALRHGEWLDSGDYGYLVDGEIHLTGRAKEVIIRAGRNIYPYELEQAVGRLPGVRRNAVAVFACPGPAGADRMIVLAETRERRPERLDALRTQIQQLALDLTHAPADDVVLAPPRSVPKTSSGKIRRAACRELYRRGTFTQRRAVWWQVTRLALGGVRPLLRRVWRSLAEQLFCAYAWTVCAVLALPAWLLLVSVPNRRWRRAAARGLIRILRLATGTRLTITGRRHLAQAGACVLAANHISYLDGFALLEALDADFDFVAKIELRGSRFFRHVLEGIGTRFVERFDAARGVEDTERLAHAVHAGHSLLFFPEGTFTRAPGLLPFRMGAFAVAARGAVPVVPVVIRGTRAMLRGDDRFVRHGAVHIRILPPITARGNDWPAALELRNACRAAILTHCGEPDLDQGTG